MTTVLVVDDSATTRRQVRAVLEAHGYAVVEADNGESGLAAAAAHEVDVIIADYLMPVMDGLAMIERLRSQPAHATTPIFVLSTESVGDVKRAREVGATAWIVKPFDAERLIAGIEQVLAAD